MATSKIVVDTSQLNKVVQGLEKYEKQMPGAAMSAVNRTLDHVNTRVARFVSSEYRIKNTEVKDTITKNRATKGKLLAFLKSEGRRLTLVRFRFGSAKKSIKVKIKKNESTKVVATSPKAFIQNLRGNDQIMKRQGKKRKPVEVLRTISVPQMIDSLKVSEKIQTEANKKLAERIDHEINYRLKKVGAK